MRQKSCRAWQYFRLAFSGRIKIMHEWEYPNHGWLQPRLCHDDVMNIFGITGPLWGESTAPDFFHKRLVMRGIDVSFDISLNKLLIKQSRGRWIICNHVYFKKMARMHPTVGNIHVEILKNWMHNCRYGLSFLSVILNEDVNAGWHP